MSYTSRHRYKSRREKFAKAKRNTLVFILFAIIILSILAFKNWQQIYDWFVLTF